MQTTKHHRKLEEYGHHILYNRTVVQGVSIGDTFIFPGLKCTWAVSFFFKDKYFPILLCACCSNANDEMFILSIGSIKNCMPVKKVEQPVKRQRRSLFNL